MTVTVFFHDLSNHNAALPDGPCISKATQGTSFVDVNYVRNRDWTLSHGWPFLAYHFIEHGNVQAQVEHAIAVIGHGQPVMIDMEWVVIGGVRQPDPTMDDFWQFVDLWPKLGGSTVSLGYIPHEYWREIGSPASLAQLPAHDIGLVSSYYTTYSDTGPGWLPYAPGMPAPTVWQYTSSPLDSNAFKGTVDELRALFNGGGDVPLTQADADLVATTVVQKWLGKSGPTVGAALQNAISDAAAQKTVSRDEFTELSAKVDQILVAIAAISTGADHTHTVTATAAGSTGPAVPLDPTP